VADLVDIAGPERLAFIGRELTKMHEQCVQATLAVLLQRLDAGEIVAKGEFVLVLGGCREKPTSTLEVDQLLTELAAHLPPKEAARLVARVTGGKPNELYPRLLKLTSKSG
jgi:16S rRNA (cytidine1402-2'-O)-methyltransferase